MQKKNSKIINFAIVAVLAFVLGYYFRGTIPSSGKIATIPTQIEEQTVSTSPTAFPTDKEAITTLVNKFEDYQKKRDSDILELFTPTRSPEEANALSFLLASDLPVSDAPRLFMTANFGYKLTDYKIQKITDSQQRRIVEIEEDRSGYDNTSGKWISLGKKLFELEIVQNGPNFMVDKYHVKNGKNGKYDGFYE